MTEPTATIPVPTGSAPVVIRVPGTPVSWKRPRQGARGNRYTDPDAKAWSRAIRAEVDAELRRRGIFARPVCGPDEAVCVEVVAAFPRPARAKRPLPLGGYADLDNLAKGAMDAMNALAYADDAQVARLTVAKVFVDGPGFLEICLWDADAATAPRDPMMETSDA